MRLPTFQNHPPGKDRGFRNLKLRHAPPTRNSAIPPYFETISLAARRLQVRLGLSESLAKTLASLAGFNDGVRH